MKNYFLFLLLQLKKNQQNRNNQKALKRVEKEKCKHFQVGNTSKEGFSPPDGLVFNNEPYGVSTNFNRPASLTDSYEHTVSVQVTADEENGSTEPNLSVGNCITQVEDNSIDELVPYYRTTESDAPETCIEHFPVGPVASVASVRGQDAAASASGDEDAKEEQDLRVSELMNYADKTSPFGDETSIKSGTIGHAAANEDQHAGANEEMVAQNGGSENHVDTKIPDTASSVPDETPSDRGKSIEIPARPVTDSVGSTEIHEKFRSRSVLVDKCTDGPCSSRVCDERLPVEIHQCDYTIISSPRVLKVVLRACSRHKANEEEVGEANKFSKICLSGWHLRCENGSWIVVEQGRSHSGCDSPAIKIPLSERLDAFFHKEERLWTVIENVHVTNEAEEVKNPIQNQDVSDIFAGTENSSSDFIPQDQSGSCTVVPNPRPESANQGPLHAAIQQFFQRMVTLRRSVVDALGHNKHETIIEIICKSLCSALWELLSAGLGKRPLFFGKYTVWDVVKEFKEVSSHVCQTVDWVNTKYASLGETEKFQAFVCECLNIGHGILPQWLKSLFRQNEKKLNKYYNQDGIVFHLSREKLEELVSDLSRISSLRFDLNFESWIRTQGYDLNKAAFTFE